MRKLRTSELNRLSIEEFKSSSKMPVIVVLDNIRSLNNVGSVFRTSDALKVERIVLCGITATPPHKEIHKTALGAEDAVDWQYFENTEDAIVQLKSEGWVICSLEQVENSTSIIDFAPEKDAKYAIVLGNEVKGVQQKIVNMSDACIEIPQYGTKHSFNVSVSAGIVLWELFRKLN
ncbi:RNA methyltransferase [Carboxylicivirga sediminis]|uniref:RNA methyltransferase n=1 Tax=Carboxylicivirga sediminis TaxID=2006564 RepID=A0A941IXK4_9BACT|nr:RNA methyltransferase [Carboxylicivirga sediminis]MBR8535693.1 RNA methyltransferase [Carboxylicivirga sediminis]